MSPVVEPITESAILRRLLAANQQPFDPATANFVLSLDFTLDDHERMNELSAKAQEGALSSAEERELESYLNVGDLLAIMQSKARISLREANQFN